MEVAPNGGSQHDAGAIVVRKDDGPFVSPGGQHNLPGSHVPQSCGSRRRATLHDQDVLVVVIRDGGGASQQADFCHRLETIHGRLYPVHRRRAIDVVVGAEQGAAKLAAVIGDEDARATPSGGKRGSQTGGSPADDQHVTVHVPFVVSRRRSERQSPLPLQASPSQAGQQVNLRRAAHRV